MEGDIALSGGQIKKLLIIQFLPLLRMKYISDRALMVQDRFQRRDLGKWVPYRPAISKSSLFWYFTQRELVVIYRRLGPIFKGQTFQVPKHR